MKHGTPNKVMKVIAYPRFIEIYQISSRDKSENTSIKYVTGQPVSANIVDLEEKRKMSS